MQKEQFRIQGLNGRKALSGELPVRGAKNAVLPMMAGALLFKDPLTITNVPDIEDVERMSELLKALGASVTRPTKRRITIDARAVENGAVSREISKRLRASVILTGPLLARYGKVVFPHPGGCVIGPRPIDLFLEGYRKMGARVRRRNENYTIEAPDSGLIGADIFFKIVSVTATETFMMAAVRAEGKTTLHNAAMEPEIQDLARFLNKCGARIKGAGTPTIEITGTPLLASKGKAYRTLPDRIEAGSFLILGALTAGDLRITNCKPEHLSILTAYLKDAGVPVVVEKNALVIAGNRRKKNGHFNSFNVRTHEYPGFPTDLQAPMTVFLTQAAGEAVVFETIFENRLNYTEDLVTMGADIVMWDSHRVMVKGPTQLKGHELDGPDIRAGLAFIIAAAVAKGESRINNIYYIDRGYEAIEARLRGIGLPIEREAAQ